jgi:glycosyltransferase involved in cell wall biosynthesis
MTAPKLSVGLPVYNGADYLPQAIQSILHQTFTDFELILSDNASTDHTARICRDFQRRDPRIRYVRQMTNIGVGRNFTFVFQQSTGTYFKWTASDDYCAPEFLERCVAVLERETSVILAYPRTVLVDAEGAPQGQYADGLHLCMPAAHQRFRQFFATQGLSHALYGVIRSDVLRRTALIGSFPMSDRVLLGELSLHGQLFEISDALFYRRVHSRMLSSLIKREVDLVGWFHPAKIIHFAFPRWRRLWEYLRAIQRSSLNISEKVRCVLQIAVLGLSADRWEGLGRDIWNNLAR